MRGEFYLQQGFMWAKFPCGEISTQRKRGEISCGKIFGAKITCYENTANDIIEIQNLVMLVLVISYCITKIFFVYIELIGCTFYSLGNDFSVNSRKFKSNLL